MFSHNVHNCEFSHFFLEERIPLLTQSFLMKFNYCEIKKKNNCQTHTHQCLVQQSGMKVNTGSIFYDNEASLRFSTISYYIFLISSSVLGI